MQISADAEKRPVYDFVQENYCRFRSGQMLGRVCGGVGTRPCVAVVALHSRESTTHQWHASIKFERHIIDVFKNTHQKQILLGTHR